MVEFCVIYKGGKFYTKADNILIAISIALDKEYIKLKDITKIESKLSK